MAKIFVGVSACLLGSEVRFNGDHKLDKYIKEQLGHYFEFLPFCPEVGIGMGVPRKPIRLVLGENNKVSAVQTDDQEKDFTDSLANWIHSQHDKVSKLSGFILKNRSPSCGMERVKLYHGQSVSKDGVGIFAQSLMDNYPYLPVEEDGRLHDPVLRENFLERIFVFNRWQNMIERGVSKKALLQFHQAHKFQLMAHSQEKYRELGQMLSDLSGDLTGNFCNNYILALMNAFKIKANRKSHANVLLHLLGYLKKNLDAHDKKTLINVIETYRQGEVPLIVPVTLLRYFFGKYPSEYVKSQYYLEPHPNDLSLRNQL